MSERSDHLSETLSALPFLGEIGTIVDETTARRIRVLLGKQGGVAASLLDCQIETLESEITTELVDITTETGTFLLTASQLQGIIAKSAIRGFTQAKVSTAEALQTQHQFEEQFKEQPAA